MHKNINYLNITMVCILFFTNSQTAQPLKNITIDNQSKDQITLVAGREERTLLPGKKLICTLPEESHLFIMVEKGKNFLNIIAVKHEIVKVFTYGKRRLIALVEEENKQ